MTYPAERSAEHRARDDALTRRIQHEQIEEARKLVAYHRKNLKNASRFGEGGDKGFCPKCGGSRKGLTFRLRKFVDGTANKEYLRVTCACDHTWTEHTKDAK